MKLDAGANRAGRVLAFVFCSRADVGLFALRQSASQATSIVVRRCSSSCRSASGSLHADSCGCNAAMVSPDARMRGSVTDEPALTGGDAYVSDTVFGDAMYKAAVRSPAEDSIAAASGRHDKVHCCLLYLYQSPPPILSVKP
jgi:hypothetical protein